MSYVLDHHLRSVCFVNSIGQPNNLLAFERTLKLCRATGAELSIAGTVECPPRGLAQLLSQWCSSAETISNAAEEQQAIQQLTDLAASQGVAASCKLLEGNRFIELSREVIREKHDLLIKTADSVRPFQSLFLGHTDRQLIRKCPSAIWIQQPTASSSFSRILAAVDPSPFIDEPDVDNTRAQLNTAIMQMAQLLAQVEQAELHVVNVWSFDIEPALRSRAGLNDDAVRAVGTSLKAQHETALARLIAPYRRNISRIHFLKGHAAEEILQVAKAESIDLIVMGTVCRSGLEGLLIGNTAETTLDIAPCSVLTIKPEGFISPVRN